MHIPTHFAGRMLLCCAIVAAPAFALAQASAPAKPAVGAQMSPSATYDKLLSGMEKEFVDPLKPCRKTNTTLCRQPAEFKGVRTLPARSSMLPRRTITFWRPDV